MAGRRAAQCDGGQVPMSRGGEGEGPSVADRLVGEIADAIVPVRPAEEAMKEHVRRSGELIAAWFARQQKALTSSR